MYSWTTLIVPLPWKWWLPLLRNTSINSSSSWLRWYVYGAAITFPSLRHGQLLIEQTSILIFVRRTCRKRSWGTNLTWRFSRCLIQNADRAFGFHPINGFLRFAPDCLFFTLYTTLLLFCDIPLCLVSFISVTVNITQWPSWFHETLTLKQRFINSH